MRAITVSKIYKKFEKCEYKDSCNNKKIVACAEAKIPKSNIKNATIRNNRKSQPLHERTSITIKIGKFGNTSTTLEKIKENIAIGWDLKNKKLVLQDVKTGLVSRINLEELNKVLIS